MRVCARARAAGVCVCSEWLEDYSMQRNIPDVVERFVSYDDLWAIQTDIRNVLDSNSLLVFPALL